MRHRQGISRNVEIFDVAIKDIVEEKNVRRQQNIAPDGKMCVQNAELEAAMIKFLKY